MGRNEENVGEIDIYPTLRPPPQSSSGFLGVCFLPVHWLVTIGKSAEEGADVGYFLVGEFEVA